MAKYNHAMTVAFEVISDNPRMPSLDEAMQGLRKRLADLESDRGEAREALLTEVPFDTYIVDEDSL